MHVRRGILMVPVAVCLCLALTAPVTRSALAQDPAAIPDNQVADSAPRKIAIVTHPDNPVNELTKAELGRLFLKKRTFWETGARCVPINQPGSTEIRDLFYRTVLDLDQTELKRYWMQETMTGNARPPVTVDNAAIVKKYIEKLPGAVAYIWADEVDETVTIIRIRDVPEFAVPAISEDAPEDATKAP